MFLCCTNAITFQKIIALRFDDGHGLVSIPEFLEFFMIPEDIRVAKSAASAVRMSLDLLSFDVELLGEGKEEEQENEKNQGNTLLKGGKGKESISQSLRREKDKTLMSKSIDTSRLYDEVSKCSISVLLLSMTNLLSTTRMHRKNYVCRISPTH